MNDRTSSFRLIKRDAINEAPRIDVDGLHKGISVIFLMVMFFIY